MLVPLSLLKVRAVHTHQLPFKMKAWIAGYNAIDPAMPVAIVIGVEALALAVAEKANSQLPLTVVVIAIASVVTPMSAWPLQLQV